ncbi:hypothetical protein MIR68_002736 [Amoeboaphelidium protococcarum]|nr:hypothetical protein MIR68_002736 [Amoeboaphelidium protococcarum]
MTQIESESVIQQGWSVSGSPWFQKNFKGLAAQYQVDSSVFDASSDMLWRVKEILDGMQTISEDLSFTQACDEYSDTPWPKDQYQRDIQIKFGFQKPASVHVVGSFMFNQSMINDGISSGPSIDMAIEMPAPLFQKKDYLNYKYFQKRAFYLAVVKRALEHGLDSAQCRVEYHNIDSSSGRRSCLLISPASQKNADQSLFLPIKIIPFVRDTVFDAVKLIDGKCCVRDPQQDDTASAPTPHYNCDVLRDMCVLRDFKFTHAALQLFQYGEEALFMAKLYFKAQFTANGRVICHGGLQSQVVTLLFSHYLMLKSSQSLSDYKSVSAYSLFQGFLHFIASKNLVGSAQQSLINLTVYEGGWNVLHGVSHDQWKLIQSVCKEAVHTLALDEDSNSNFIARATDKFWCAKMFQI